MIVVLYIVGFNEGNQGENLEATADALQSTQTELIEAQSTIPIVSISSDFLQIEQSSVDDNVIQVHGYRFDKQHNVSTAEGADVTFL